MSVLLSILGGSMSSRLFQEVREKRGLAYTTYAYDVAYSDTGTFGMYAGCSPDKVGEVETIMRAQLEDLAGNGPTEEEMTRVRGQVRGGVVLGLEDNWSRMMRLGRSEIIGRYRPARQAGLPRAGPAPGIRREMPARPRGPGHSLTLRNPR